MNTYEKTQIIAKAMGWYTIGTTWVTHKGDYINHLPDFYVNPEYAWDVMRYFADDFGFNNVIGIRWDNEYKRILKPTYDMLQQAHAILDHTLYLIKWRDSVRHHITYTCMTCNYTTTVHCDEREITKALEHIGYEYAAHPDHMHVIHSVITDKS